MRNFLALSARFCRDEDGLTTVEYAVIIGLVVVVCVAAVVVVGQNTGLLFTAADNGLQGS